MSPQRIARFILLVCTIFALTTCKQEPKKVYYHCTDIPDPTDCAANTQIEGGCQWLTSINKCVQIYPQSCSNIYEQTTCAAFTVADCVWKNSLCIDDPRGCQINGNPCSAVSGCSYGEDDCHSVKIATLGICSFDQGYISCSSCYLNGANPCPQVTRRAQCGVGDYALCIWQ